MQGRNEDEGKLFFPFGLSRLLPVDHPVRRIREIPDLRFLYKETRQY